MRDVLIGVFAGAAMTFACFTYEHSPALENRTMLCNYPGGQMRFDGKTIEDAGNRKFKIVTDKGDVFQAYVPESATCVIGPRLPAQSAAAPTKPDIET